MHSPACDVDGACRKCLGEVGNIRSDAGLFLRCHLGLCLGRFRRIERIGNVVAAIHQACAARRIAGQRGNCVLDLRAAGKVLAEEGGIAPRLGQIARAALGLVQRKKDVCRHVRLARQPVEAILHAHGLIGLSGGRAKRVQSNVERRVAQTGSSHDDLMCNNVRGVTSYAPIKPDYRTGGEAPQPWLAVSRVKQPTRAVG